MAGYFGCKCGGRDEEQHAARVAAGYPGHVFKDDHYWVTTPQAIKDQEKKR